MDLVRLKRAFALTDSGRFEEAVAELDSLAELASNEEETGAVLIGKLSCFLNWGRIKEARQCLAELQKQLPGLPESDLQPRVKLFEATILNHEGKMEEALGLLNQILGDYSALLNLDENRDLYEEVQKDRGLLIAELDRLSEARPILEEALSFETELREVHYHLGVCYFESGDLKRAKEQFMVALRASVPNHLAGRAHYHLGMIHYREGGYARAKQEFEAAEPLAKESNVPRKYIYGWLARTCHALGLQTDAERYRKLRAAEKA
jgi:tetratricopeptide (TPR) repeat protein